MSEGAAWALLNGHPAWLVALAALAVLALVSGLKSSRGLSRRRRAFLLALRLAALALVAVAVVRPAREVDLLRAKRSPLVVVTDDSRSMTLGPDPAGAAAARWLAGGDLDEGVGEYYRIEYVALGDPPPAVDRSGLGAGGVFQRGESPLGRTLEALARSRPELAGVVLVSDGRDTERPGVPPQGLPFPVFAAAPQGEGAPDLWVEGVEIPPVAFIRTPVDVRVKLGVQGLPRGPAAVTLLEGGRPLASQVLDVGASGGEGILSFVPQRTGRKAYRVEVSPWPGEAGTENNRSQFSLNVVRDKTRVLLVGGTPSWDVKFLRRRLRQDPGVDLITFLILRTPQDLNLVPQDELSLIPFPTQELFSQELPSFDAVVFANFDYGPYVPRHYLDNLVRFVEEAGGGFAMLGGDRSFSLGGYEGSPLERILPVEFSGAAPGRAYAPGTFRPRLTEEGVRHPLFQWLPDPEANRDLWNRLPELQGMNWMLRAKPGAVVLAENPEARNEYGPQPLVALGEYGNGRTLVVACDSLWRWGLPHAGAGGGDEIAYRDFWTRALRWLIHDPEMELVRLSMPPGPLRAGEKVRLKARVLDRAYNPAEGARVTGALAGEGREPVPVEWRETAPGEYATEEVRFPSSGLWRVEVQGSLNGTFLGRDAAEFPVEPESPEALRLGVDLAYLRALAEDSGGAVFRLGERGLLDALRERARTQVEVVGRRVEEVWATPWLLCASVLLFGLDWALRRFWE